MACHGRLRLILCLCVAWLIATASPLTCRADTALAFETLPVSWQDDAELTDVFFLNATTGWAVGAQGVILRTADGGKSWLQHGAVSNKAIRDVPLNEKLHNMRHGVASRWTGVAGEQSQVKLPRCRFESIHFIDAKHGWVAGGYDVPWVGRSKAAVFRTADGGVTWQRLVGQTMARLTKIRFANARNGWAIGEANALHPTGLSFTQDGGATWSSTASAQANTWVDGSQTPQGFVLIDQAGSLALLSGQRSTRPALFNCSRDACLSAVAMQTEQVGYACGDDGLILTTDSAGKSWKRLRTKVATGESAGELADINFRDIELTADSAWLSSKNRAGLWRLNLADGTLHHVTLPTRMPLRSLSFPHRAEGKTGFAVGELGTIFKTIDGGQTWQRQRGTQDRLALLIVANRATDVPLELLSIHASEEHRICGTLLLDQPTSQQATARQAFERLGSTVNLHLAGQSDLERQKELLRSIQTLQPLVVVCCRGTDSASRMAVNQRLQQDVQQAIKAAAKPGRDGLRGWQVERLVTSDFAGDVRFDTRRMLPTMGISIADQIAVSRAIQNKSVRREAASAWRVEHPGPRRRMQGDDFLSGLGRGAKVPLRQQRTALGNLNRVKVALAKQKQASQFAKLTAETDSELLGWRQKLMNVVMPMEAETSGLWLVDLADRYLAAGHYEMVAHTLELLSNRMPEHAFAPAATAWLAIYYNSDELAQIERLRKKQTAETTDGQAIRLASVSEASASTDLAEPEPVTDGLFADRVRLAATALGRLTRNDAAAVMEPGWQWLESRMLAKLSGEESIVSRLTQFQKNHSGQHAVFVDAAWRHQQLLKKQTDDADSQQKSDADYVSVQAASRPKLDGQLNDAVWQRATAQMRGKDAVYFAHDEAYFYGAYRCQKLPTYHYGFRKKARPRDPDLTRRDRVQLQIDTDFDFASAVTLVVDHRGWVADSAFGSSAWNPDWYVAQAEDEQSWTVEFAIPLDQFAAYLPAAGGDDALATQRAWAVRLQRLDYTGASLWQPTQRMQPTETNERPSIGLRASLSARPSGFQLLRFEAAPRRRIGLQPLDVQRVEDRPAESIKRLPPRIPNL